MAREVDLVTRSPPPEDQLDAREAARAVRGDAAVRRVSLLGVLLVLASAIAVSLTLASPRPAAAQVATPTPTPTTLMRVSPASQTVAAGSNVVVDIFVDNVAGLGAYEFELAYEPTVLSFVSVANGT